MYKFGLTITIRFSASFFSKTIRYLVDATEIYINGAPEIEIEQGQSFDLEIFCRNSSGEVSHGRFK